MSPRAFIQKTTDEVRDAIEKGEGFWEGVVTDGTSTEDTINSGMYFAQNPYDWMHLDATGLRLVLKYMGTGGGENDGGPKFYQRDPEVEWEGEGAPGSMNMYDTEDLLLHESEVEFYQMQDDRAHVSSAALGAGAPEDYEDEWFLGPELSDMDEDVQQIFGEEEEWVRRSQLPYDHPDYSPSVADERRAYGH